jgi:aminopeptidase I
LSDYLLQDWTTKLKLGGKYYITRNETALIAFHIDESYAPNDPIAIIASHIDALTLKLKPVSKSEKGGFERLAVAPYGGGGKSQTWDGDYSTWWDRDLGLGGKVLVQGKAGKVESRLVSLSRPGELMFMILCLWIMDSMHTVARIPSLAVHFGAPALGESSSKVR